MERDSQQVEGVACSAGLEAFRTELRIWIKSGFIASTCVFMQSLVHRTVIKFHPFKDPYYNPRTSAAVPKDCLKQFV